MTATKLTDAQILGILDRLADAAESLADAAQALQFGEGQLSDSFSDDSPVHDLGHVVEAAAWDVMTEMGSGEVRRDALRKSSRTLRQVVALSREGEDAR